MADVERARRRQQAGCPDLPEDIMYEILLLLPPKSVLRCRAVCRAWLRLASDRGFLLTHYRRQPSLPLVYFVLNDGRDPDVSEYRLAVFDLRTNELQDVVGLSGHRNRWMVRENRLALHGSCNGVLLLSSDDQLYLCNPTTRHWAPLPPVHLNSVIAGLYWHGPSEDYRVLYCRRNRDRSYHTGLSERSNYFVMAVGSGKERLVCRHVFSVNSSSRTGFARQTPPVLLHGNLHWPPVPSTPEHVTVFDTVAEVFRWIPSPVPNVNSRSGLNVKLLDTEGVLAMSSCWSEATPVDGPSRVDLWLLEDYNVWVCKYRVELPVEDISHFLGLLDMWSAVVVSSEGDVLVDLMHCLLRFDREGNLLANLPCDCSLLEIGPHMLKRSLDPHASLPMKNRGSHKPPFL